MVNFDKYEALQDILVKENELQTKKDAAPKQLQNQKELLEKTIKQHTEQKAEFDAINDKIGKLKSDLEETVKALEESEKAIANSTTHREYETYEKQVAEGKDKEEELRKELQKEEKELASLNEKIKNDEELIEFQNNEYESAKKSIDEECAKYDAELAQLNKDKEAISKDGLENEIVFKLQRIIQRNSEGIVAVRNGVCTGCHMILPANFANEVREGDSIKFCPYCSRILRYEEVAEDSGEEYFDMNAIGSFADDDDFDEESDAEFDEEMEEKDAFDEETDDEITDEDADDEDDVDEGDEENDEE